MFNFKSTTSGLVPRNDLIIYCLSTVFFGVSLVIIKFVTSPIAAAFLAARAIALTPIVILVLEALGYTDLASSRALKRVPEQTLSPGVAQALSTPINRLEVLGRATFDLLSAFIPRDVKQQNETQDEEEAATLVDSDSSDGNESDGTASDSSTCVDSGDEDLPIAATNATSSPVSPSLLKISCLPKTPLSAKLSTFPRSPISPKSPKTPTLPKTPTAPKTTTFQKSSTLPKVLPSDTECLPEATVPRTPAAARSRPRSAGKQSSHSRRGGMVGPIFAMSPKEELDSIYASRRTRTSRNTSTVVVPHRHPETAPKPLKSILREPSSTTIAPPPKPSSRAYSPGVSVQRLSGPDHLAVYPAVELVSVERAIVSRSSRR